MDLQMRLPAAYYYGNPRCFCARRGANAHGRWCVSNIKGEHPLSMELEKHFFLKYKPNMGEAAVNLLAQG